VPVTGEGTDAVATIAVFKDISLEKRAARKARNFNVGVAGVSWMMTGLVFGAYAYHQRGVRISCEDAYAREESQTIEFKSTLRWDSESQKANKELERAVVKTIAAFLNTDGGVLLIGVDDEKKVLGLEGDYKTLPEKPNKDGFELALQQALSKAMVLIPMYGTCASAFAT
jgi:Schlafen, AlbA_2